MSENNKPGYRINEAVIKILNESLKTFCGESLNSSTCMAIYRNIFDGIVEIFEKSNMKLSNEAMNYIAQCYYDAVNINETTGLDPNIFTQRAHVGNINTKELAFIATLFNGIDYITVPLIVEIKKRSL